MEEPAALAELQKNEWDPIVAWAEKRYEVKDVSVCLCPSEARSSGACDSQSCNVHEPCAFLRGWAIVPGTMWQLAPQPASWGQTSPPAPRRPSSAIWRPTTCGPCKVREAALAEEMVPLYGAEECNVFPLLLIC